MPLVDLFETAVRQDLRGGAEAITILRRAGLPDGDEIISLVCRLKSVYEAQQGIEQAMLALAADPNANGHANEAFRDYARCQQQRSDVRAAFEAWLMAEGAGGTAQ